jgi:hypothetical protein
MGRKSREIDEIEEFEPEEQETSHAAASVEDTFPNLPALPLPSRITQLSTKNQVIRQDAEMYHSMFLALSMQWGQVTSVDEVIKLSLATSKLIMDRRRALLLPCAAAPTEESDDRYVLPLD